MRSLIFILFFLGAFSQTVFACSCGTVPFMEAVESSDEIFIGKVIKVELKHELFPTKESDILPRPSGDYWVVTLEVSKKWKGSRKSKVRVRQTFNSCEFPFEFSGEYLVFSEKDGLRWNGTRSYWTWLCSRTIDTIYHNEWLKEDWTFDDRKKLDDKFPNPVRTASFFNNWPIWLLLFITSIGFGSFYIKKRSAL